jgi:hypothetical protein
MLFYLLTNRSWDFELQGRLVAIVSSRSMASPQEARLPLRAVRAVGSDPKILTPLLVPFPSVHEATG